MLAIHLLLSNVHRGDTQPRSNIAFTAPHDNWLWANNLYKASAHPFLCSLFTLGVSTPTDLLTVLPLVLLCFTLVYSFKVYLSVVYRVHCTLVTMSTYPLNPHTSLSHPPSHCQCHVMSHISITSTSTQDMRR